MSARLYHGGGAAAKPPKVERFRMVEIPSVALKRRWLEALLPDVAHEGWTEQAAKRAAERAGLSAGEQALAAPGGVVDLIDFLFDTVAVSAIDALRADPDLSSLGTTAKVAKAVRLWLDALAPHREAVRRAASRGLLPWMAAPALMRTWTTADMIWTGIGDTSTDYNRYTKRALLAATLPGIVLRWLEAPADPELDAVIMARLRQVSEAGRRLGNLARPILRGRASA